MPPWWEPPPGARPPMSRSRPLLFLAACGVASALVLPSSGCSDYRLGTEDDDPTPQQDDDTTPPDDDTTGPVCPDGDWPAHEVDAGDECTPDNPSSGVSPVVEWEWGNLNGCLSLPSVGDIDGDGATEVVLNHTTAFNAPGDLVVLNGASGTEKWSDTAASLGFGAGPVLADLDDDGLAEILVVKEYASSLLFTPGDYTVVCYSATGEVLWETEHFLGADFEYAAGIVVSDMDHDGSPEIVAGRVIFTASGATRGVGGFGNGTSGLEGPIPAVTDLDLDGTEEVVTGNAMYGPDGELLFFDEGGMDGFVSIANLDGDPEGEYVVISSDKIHAHDTDGALLWGPDHYEVGSGLSPAAIADIDLDGMPEVMFAGSNRLYAVNHDGTPLWDNPIIDESGATGPSVFDFGGDGRPEVVHIDEIQIMAIDGPTGDVVFQTDDHGSNTMFDYAIIADVDNDDQAEIVVCHNFYSSTISVYGDPEGNWVPARPVWNQHAYGITNINDDLSVPVDAVPSFVDNNTWHSAIATNTGSLKQDLEARILDVCDYECDRGVLEVVIDVRNRGLEAAPAGVSVALYATDGVTSWLVATGITGASIDTGWTTPGMHLQVDAAALAGATGLKVQADDDGTGTGTLSECSETNNESLYDGPLCPAE